jgi:hypothetical protein
VYAYDLVIIGSRTAAQVVGLGRRSRRHRAMMAASSPGTSSTAISIGRTTGASRPLHPQFRRSLRSASAKRRPARGAQIQSAF